MITREKLENTIYYNLTQSTELINYLSPMPQGVTIQSYVRKAGTELASEEIYFPAIRYRIQSQTEDYQQGNGTPRQTVLFDIFIETRSSDNDQANALLDIMRDIFPRNNGGRGVGALTETTNFITTYGDSTIDVYYIRERVTDQRMSSDEQGNLPMKAPLQRIIFSMIRFEMGCTDLNIYTS